MPAGTKMVLPVVALAAVMHSLRDPAAPSVVVVTVKPGHRPPPEVTVKFGPNSEVLLLPSVAVPVMR